MLLNQLPYEVMMDVNVLRTGVDGGLLAEENSAIVVVENGGREHVYSGDRYVLHGEYIQEASEPKNVFGAVPHCHVLSLS